MNIELSTDKEQQLAQLAASLQTDPGTMLARAVDRMLADDAAFRAAVQVGLDQLDRGETVSHDDVMKDLHAQYDR